MKKMELMDGYLQKTLSKEEKKEFAKAVDKDTEFNKEFQELKEIQEGVKSHSRQEIKSFLMEIEKDLNTDESTLNNTNMKKMISVAASLVLIAAISFFALTQDKTPSLDDLYAEHYTHYENLNGQVRGASSDLSSLSDQAFNAYDLGNYNLAAASFAELVKSDKSATNYFYMGMSNLESKNYEAAIHNLNTTVNNFEAFKNQATWYLSLAHFANGDEDAGISGLVRLTREESTYKEKAEAILKEMGLSWSTLDGGVVEHVEKRPRDDAPSGVESFGERKWQIGRVTSYSNGYKYRFITDDIIENLNNGSEVEMIILRSNKKRKSGFAYILGVTN